MYCQCAVTVYGLMSWLDQEIRMYRVCLMVATLSVRFRKLLLCMVTVAVTVTVHSGSKEIHGKYVQITQVILKHTGSLFSRFIA
jgi:hypothetical protein